MAIEVEKKSHKSISESNFRPDMISIANALQSQGILLDVRNAGELPKVVHKRCIQLSLAELSENWKRLDLEKEICIFCKSGQRSIQAAELLNQLGFQKIKLIKGGANELVEQMNYEKDIS